MNFFKLETFDIPKSDAGKGLRRGLFLVPVLVVVVVLLLFLFG